MPRIYTKYKATRSRGGWRAGLYWCSALVCLVFLGWLFWRSEKQAETQPAEAAREPGQRPPAGGAPPAPPSAATATPPASPFPSAVTSVPPALASRPAPALTRPDSDARPVQNVLEAQIALASRGISPGSLDGVPGTQTRAALRVFQRQEGLPLTGALDSPTKARLLLEGSPLVAYTVTSYDLARLLPVSRTWLEKSEQDRLDFETILELVAEKSRTHPNLIRRLNPGVDWTNIVAGMTLRVPNVIPPIVRRRAALLRIHLAAKTLEVFDARTNLLAHFPCSIARQVEKRPVGELHVSVVALNPNYTFNPEIFPESAEARELDRKLVLRPGPNNPVGTAWIGLDRPGYGIHGTPRPEEVGRTESHGCFRLANWNAEFLAQMVAVGTLVYVEP